MKFIEFESMHDIPKAFPTEQSCADYLERVRWGTNIISPFDSTSVVYKCSGGRYRCKNTKKYFTVRTGTIMSDSKISLQKWLIAFFLFGSHKKGLSSYQLVRYLGIKQKAAWFMLHRLRFAMSQNLFFDLPLSGTIESDTAYLGGKESNKHENKKSLSKTKNKAAVIGMVQRGGRVIMRYVPDHSFKHVLPLLKKNLSSDAKLITDEGAEFAGASQLFDHQTINHSKKEYVRYVGATSIHTNSCEGLWANLKRGIYGTYHFTSTTHLQAYLNEFSFRYNRRKDTQYDATNAFIEKSFEGSLKWKDLIKKGKEEK